MHKKIKLVISGSGTRYPVQLGAIIRLLELGIQIEEVVGTSGGAICAAALGSGYDKNSLLKLATATLPSNVLEKNWLPFGGTKSRYSNNKIIRTFRTLFVETFAECKIPVHIVAHNWSRKIKQVFQKDKEDLPLAVNASMCLPIFDMVEIAGDLFEDGGIDANFYIDYQDWEIKNDTPVIGLRIRSTADLDPNPRKNPVTKIDRIFGTVSDLIEACDKEHIEDALWAKTIVLQTSYAGLKLDIREQDVVKMIQEGKDCINQALKEGILG